MLGRAATPLPWDACVMFLLEGVTVSALVKHVLFIELHVLLNKPVAQMCTGLSFLYGSAGKIVDFL